METKDKDIVIEKIKALPPEQVEKVLIFMAGLEAGITTESTSKKIITENKLGRTKDEM